MRGILDIIGRGLSAGSLVSAFFGDITRMAKASRGGPGRRGLYTYHSANHGWGSQPVSGGGARECARRVRQRLAREQRHAAAI